MPPNAEGLTVVLTSIDALASSDVGPEGDLIVAGDGFAGRGDGGVDGGEITCGNGRDDLGIPGHLPARWGNGLEGNIDEIGGAGVEDDHRELGGLTGGDVGIEPLVGGCQLHGEATGDLYLERRLGVDPAARGQ